MSKKRAKMDRRDAKSAEAKLKALAKRAEAAIISLRQSCNDGELDRVHDAAVMFAGKMIARIHHIELKQFYARYLEKAALEKTALAEKVAAEGLRRDFVPEPEVEDI